VAEEDPPPVPLHGYRGEIRSTRTAVESMNM